MMNNTKKVLIFLSILFITACTMPETRMYTLYLPVEGGTIDTKTDASIVILVNSERYLRQPYIAHRNSPYQLKISKYSKWELPPREIVKNEFKNALSSKGQFKEVSTASVTSRGFYSLKVYLKKFERLDEGNDSFGRLVFDVNLLSPDGDKLYNSTISKKVGLDDRQFSSLAKGLSSALEQGIEEVRANVVRAVNK